MTYLNLLFILGWVVIGSTAFVSIFWSTLKFEDWVDKKVNLNLVAPLCLLVWAVQATVVGGHIVWAIKTLDSLWFPVLP